MGFWSAAIAAMLATTMSPMRMTTMTLSRPVTLAGGRLPSAPERNQHEEDDEDDRQPKERSLQTPAAAIRGRLTTEGGREPRTARLQQDRGRDRDGNDDLTYLKGVQG